MGWWNKADQDMHPITRFVHHKICKVISRYQPTSIIDVGGKGRLNGLLECEVVNANLRDGIDGTDLPFPDNSFDLAVSIATLEHVGGTERQVQFVRECRRVSKKASVHWFPAGECAAKIERLKARFGHKHQCLLPDDALRQIEEEYEDVNISPFMSCSEHLLLLASISRNINIDEVYDFVEGHGNETYGVILEIQ